MYKVVCGLHDAHVRIICPLCDVTHVRKCGAIATANTTVLGFSGTNSFFNNLAKVVSGGAIYVWTIGYSYSMITFNGTNIFIGNSANNVSGGAIVEIANTSMGFNGAIHFSHNFARNEGGAVLIANSALLNFTGTNNKQ